ncbi:histone H1.10-like [Seriola dumerili]|uniref:histone H1.10-like n=1 Tax=Seriola dumerili TaxID=41447 RepID=UPI000BBE2850|nr:histone H1.10-like [Seriola dumerili]
MSPVRCARLLCERPAGLSLHGLRSMTQVARVARPLPAKAAKKIGRKGLSLIVGLLKKSFMAAQMAIDVEHNRRPPSDRGHSRPWSVQGSWSRPKEPAKKPQAKKAVRLRSRLPAKKAKAAKTDTRKNGQETRRRNEARKSAKKPAKSRRRPPKEGDSHSPSRSSTALRAQPNAAKPATTGVKKAAAKNRKPVLFCKYCGFV